MGGTIVGISYLGIAYVSRWFPFCRTVVLEIDGSDISSLQLEPYDFNHHLWGQIFECDDDFDEVSFKLCKTREVGTIKLYVTGTVLNGESKLIPDMGNILAMGEINVADVDNVYGDNNWEFNPFLLNNSVSETGKMALVLENNGDDFIYINQQETGDIYPNGYEVVQGDDLYGGEWHTYDLFDNDFYFRLRI